MPVQVAQALTRDEGGTLDLLDTGAMPRSGDKIPITGNERGLLTFASCCLPIPGDAILGYPTPGRGLLVPPLACPTVPDSRQSPDSCIALAQTRNASRALPP